MCLTLIPISALAADDYPSKYRDAPIDSIVDEWNFYNRECTSFAAWCLNSRNGVAFTNWLGGQRWGHAKNWGVTAKALGYTVNNTPAVGAIAWWDSGDYGHVAWVSAVNGNDVTIEEYNYMCKDNNWTAGLYHTRVISSGNPTGFIHIKDMSAPAPTTVSQHYHASDYNEGWYEGEWSNGKPNGYGRLTYDDFDDGKYYSLSGADGREYKALYYEGYFVDGYRNGKGVIVYEGGYKDEGTFYGQWTAGKTVFDGKRWLISGNTEGYWPLVIVAVSAAAANDNYGSWVSTKTPDPTQKITDMVPEGHWAYGAIKYVLERHIMSGTSKTTFEPNGTVTRAMVVNMLYNLAGEPSHSGKSKFTDVPAGKWYTDAVLWASESKIVSGKGNSIFDPDGAVTREELAIMMQNYAKYIGKNVSASYDLSRFADANEVDWWATDAVKWACANGVIKGSDEGGKLYLNPKGNATRAQIAVIFENFCKKYGV